MTTFKFICRVIFLVPYKHHLVSCVTPVCSAPPPLPNHVRFLVFPSQTPSVMSSCLLSVSTRSSMQTLASHTPPSELSVWAALSWSSQDTFWSFDFRTGLVILSSILFHAWLFVEFKHFSKHFAYVRNQMSSFMCLVGSCLSPWARFHSNQQELKTSRLQQVPSQWAYFPHNSQHQRCLTWCDWPG